MLSRTRNSLRIISLNVHFFQDLSGNSNEQRIGKILKSFDADIVAFQEAFHTELDEGETLPNRYHLRNLSKFLNLPHRAFCDVSQGFGNGLLSRFPLKHSESYFAEKIRAERRRGMLEVTVEHPFFDENQAKLYVVHLDQIKESTRLEQWKIFEKYLQNNSKLQLLMGDFNALSLDDYSRDYLNRFINEVRSKNSWEPAVEFLTQRIKAAGFIDCWRETNRDVRDENSITCAYNTRIDYIWRRGSFSSNWKMKFCQIFPTNEATDHHGLIVQFDKET